MKKWPAWVNGGLLFVSIALFGIAIKFQCPVYAGCPSDYLFYPVAPAALIAPIQFIYLFYFAFYFLVGALVGYVYGTYTYMVEHPARINKKHTLHQTPAFRTAAKIEEDIELTMDEALAFELEDIRLVRAKILLNTFKHLGKIVLLAAIIVAPLFYYAACPKAFKSGQAFFFAYIAWLLLIAVARLVYNNVKKHM